jgi:hypothetical protein
MLLPTPFSPAVYSFAGRRIGTPFVEDLPGLASGSRLGASTSFRLEVPASTL